ncbi:hypothetical protein CEQ90_04545 [Lewinellaceae bacterium SD302]|nr:hypothetical protein CEQ90_04545 [Lewinellaceae bacterium SD302]
MKSLVLVVIMTNLFFLVSCDNCKPDQFGPNVELIIPVNITVPSDTITTIDTILLSANFGKDIEIFETNKKAYLEGFNFFTEIKLSNISGESQLFDIDIFLDATVGEVSTLPLPTARSYPIIFFENEDSYSFSAKLVVKEPGTFRVNFGSSLNSLLSSDHPFVYQCGDKKRVTLYVSYRNTLTHEEEFNEIYRSTQVESLLELVDYEGYAKGGTRSFVVEE